MIPLHINIGDAHQVYCCQVEGFPEGPSSSSAASCSHVHCTNLGTKLTCSLCPTMFLTLMSSDSMASRHITLGVRTQLKKGYTSVHKKNYVIYKPIHNNKKRNVAKVIYFLINHGGATSTNTIHQVPLFMLPHCFVLYIVSRVILPWHLWILYGESFGFPSGAVALRPMLCNPKFI